MPSEPIFSPGTPAVAPWGVAAEGRRPRHLALRGAGWVCAGLALLLLAAWAVPPMLDWGRFRTQIAAIAAVRLGRPVVIGGEISLRLLPQAVLTATDVTLADPGDGVSVQVAALRMQVATVPLLAGHVRLRELVLGAPVLRLPLVLPAGIAHPSRPQLPHVFAARIEGGTLRIGQTEITGITASVHGGPSLASATGTTGDALTPGAAPVAAFGAEGFAVAAGRHWRFTTALGAPDADGVSAVDVSVRGQGRVAQTGGTLQATLADGIVQGRLRAGGPDLSLLLPASALAWHVDAPFVASAERVETTAIALSLGGAPADGALTLQLASPARVEGRLHAASLDLDGWARLLGQTFGVPAAAVPVLPRLHVELAADAARLLGGTLHGLHATLLFDGETLGLDRPQALLPGGALLSADRARLSDRDARGAPVPLSVAADARLTAPDLGATLAWLRPLAPALVAGLPAAVWHRAMVAGGLMLRRDEMVVTGLHGRLDGGQVAGNVAVHLAPREAIAATLAFGELSLDGFDRDETGGLQALAGRLTGPDTALHLLARTARWRGETLTALDVDAGRDGRGVMLRRARATLDGAAVSLAGRLTPDGAVEGARLSVTSRELAQLWPHVPTAWRWAPGLWHGPAALAFAASGRPEALGLQLRVDAGDLVLEAEAMRDTLAGTGPVTLTLRHPGAPRLLAQLGLPAGLVPASAQADGWLDGGALTLRAHLQTAPGRIEAEDFDLDAAALRLSGRLAAEWDADGAERAPRLSGSIDAEQLALPDHVPALGRMAWLEDWATQLHVTAHSVLVGLRPVASDLVGDVEGAGTSVSASAVAMAAGGQLAVRLDTAAGPAVGIDWTGIVVPPSLTGWPVDLGGGLADLHADLVEDAGLSGTVRASLRGVGVTGLAGVTTVSSEVGATVTQGVAVIDAAGVSGGVDLVRRTVDLRVQGVHLSGPFDAVVAKADESKRSLKKGHKNVR